ncbi:MAG: response regulator transcription factor [Candidatus Margulisbacteria bacterium]|nr:response regulator transcription factor [Candidatus Margulisiibacteriota bacterium]
MINICIIDSHEIIRQGIKRIVSGIQDMRVVQEADTPTSTFNKSTFEPVHLIVLDPSFDSSHCNLSSIELIQCKFPQANILAFSLLDEATFGLEVLKYKVKGFVSKKSSTQSLITAIRTIQKGSLYLSPVVSQALATQYVQPHPNQFDTLSKREKEVLIFLGSGLSVKDISKKLFLSIKTISTYKRRIMEKLHLDNMVMVIKFCIQHQFISMEI